MQIAAPQEPRINDRIRAREVRVVAADGAQLGIMPTPDALNSARGQDLDLVEVAAQANPPVCRIMDYGKFKYENAQRQKESRKKSTNVVVKEMKYRPKIGPGDFDTKTRKVEKFLSEGHKVKITIMFRGREVYHPELGRNLLNRIADDVVRVGRVEQQSRLDGRNMTMVLGPDKKAQAAWEAEQRKAADEEAAAMAAAAETSEPVAAEPTEAPAPAAEAPETVAEAPAEEAPSEEVAIESTETEATE